MAQYIDKSALVAEIERRIKSVLELVHPNGYDKAALQLYKGLLSFANSLEVKDMDLNATDEQKQLNKQMHKAIDAVFENYERLYGNQNRIQL